jgi:mRNA-degrading endonuclease toxin of MazEF toxin-antitoxin module
VRQWDIIQFPFAEAGPHPAVILSADERCANPDLAHVNALICTSVRVGRPLKKHEAMLNGADGLDWETAVRCDIIHLLPKAAFGLARGRVSAARQVVIARKLAECLRLRW